MPPIKILITVLFQDVGLREKKLDFNILWGSFIARWISLDLAHCFQTINKERQGKKVGQPWNIQQLSQDQDLYCAYKDCSKLRRECLAHKLHIHSNGKLTLCSVSRNGNVLKFFSS